MVRIEGLLVASRVNNEGPSEKCPAKTGNRAVSGMSDKKGKCASWGGVFLLGPHSSRTRRVRTLNVTMTVLLSFDVPKEFGVPDEIGDMTRSPEMAET